MPPGPRSRSSTSRYRTDPQAESEGPSAMARSSSQVPAHIGGRLAVLDAELGQHGRDMVIDRLGRDEQGARDLGVGLSFADQLEHLAFTPREPEWMRPGCPARARWHRPGTYLAQLLAGEAGRRLGAQVVETPQRVAQFVFVAG